MPNSIYLFPTASASDIPVTDAGDKYNGSNAQQIFDEIGETRFWNGFDLNDPDGNGTITWDDASLTMTIAVKAGQSSYHFWAGGKKFTKTTSATVTIPDTTGVYYVWFDTAGDTQYALDSAVRNEQFFDSALFGLVHWDADLAIGKWQPEQHGIRMSGMTHLSIHVTDGAKFQKGLGITGLTSGGTTYTNNSAGAMWDEDIKHEIASASTHQFLYRSGATGAWKWTTADNKVSYDAGGSYDVWNEWTGATWTLTEGTSSTDYWIVFYACFPWSNATQVTKVIGQRSYSSRSKARDAIYSELSAITNNGLPNQEFIWLYATIVNRYGKLQALDDGSLFLDLRASRGTGNGGGTGASPVLVKVAEASSDGTDTSLVVTGLDATYEKYMLRFQDLCSAGASDNVWLRFTYSGTPHTSGYKGVLSADDSTLGAYSRKAATGRIELSHNSYVNASNTSIPGTSGEAMIYRPADSTTKGPSVNGTSVTVNDTDAGWAVFGGNLQHTAASLDGVEVTVQNGTPTAIRSGGKIILYGVTS